MNQKQDTSIEETVIATELNLIRNFPQWVTNVKNNFPFFITESDINDIKVDNPQDALIIGGGPSLQKHDHLKRLKKLLKGWNGTIFCCERKIRDCFKVDILPHFILCVDTQLHQATFFDFKDPFQDECNIILPINVDPTVVQQWEEKWKGTRYWFAPMFDQIRQQRDGIFIDRPYSITAAMSLLSEKTVLDSCGNVSGAAMVLCHKLGFKRIAFLGQDLAFSINDPKEWMKIPETDVFKAKEFRHRYDPAQAQEIFKQVKNTKNGQMYVTDPTFRFYELNMLAYIMYHKLHVTNCSEEGIFFRDPIQWMTLEEWVNDGEKK